jgi:hypothetical protein
VIKRMAPARAALAAGVLTTLLTTTFVAALVSFTQTQTATGIRSALGRQDSLVVSISGSLSARQRPQARAAIHGELRRAFGAIPFSLFGSLRVDGLVLRSVNGHAPHQLDGHAQRAPDGHALHRVDRRPRRDRELQGATTGNLSRNAASAVLGSLVPAKRVGPGGTRQIATVIAADALAAHATLIAGHWPSATPGSRPVPVALSTVAAARLGVSAGQVLALRSPYDRKDVSLRVSGVFRPLDPAGPYWRLDPLHGNGIQRAGGSPPTARCSPGPAPCRQARCRPSSPTGSRYPVRRTASPPPTCSR